MKIVWITEVINQTRIIKKKRILSDVYYREVKCEKIRFNGFIDLLPTETLNTTSR